MSLIKLTPETRHENVPASVTHLVEIDPPQVGEFFKGYCRHRNGVTWFNPGGDYAETDTSVLWYVFARAATPAEIAAEPHEIPGNCFRSHDMPTGYLSDLPNPNLYCRDCDYWGPERRCPKCNDPLKEGSSGEDGCKTAEDLVWATVDESVSVLIDLAINGIPPGGYEIASPFSGLAHHIIALRNKVNRRCPSCYSDIELNGHKEECEFNPLNHQEATNDH